MTDIIAYAVLFIAFGFAYLSKRFGLKKLDYLWTFCSVVCTGAFILIMLMRGSDMLDVALGLTAFAAAICLIDEKCEGGGIRAL